MIIKNKRAYYYTLDAFIALIIIFAVLLVIKPVSKLQTSQIQAQDDLILVLSTLRVGEFDNAYTQQLIANNLANPNLTLLEQITEYYAKGMPEAQLLSQEIFNILQPKENIGLWFNNELVASSSTKSFNQAEQIWTARQIVSGIEKPGEGDIKGYSARAFLTRSSQVKYFYFGGYVGDGNLSMQVDYTGELTDIELEIAVNKDFDIYINNIYSGHYEKSPSEFTPAKYQLDAYIEQFNSGTNIIKFVADNLYIAGGFIKIVYSNSGLYEQKTKYYFPGIEGLINIYDSFYIPGQLNSLDISMHLDSQYPAFLTIGDVKVFNDSTTGEETITLTNSYLSSLLNYNELSKKTIPLRLGLENVSYVTNISSETDVFSVTDLSGSMADSCVGASLWCCLTNFYPDVWCTGSESHCTTCGGSWNPGGLSSAKDANKILIDSILNFSGNRVGLVGYKNDAHPTRYYELTNDSVILKIWVDSWYASGSTCICCGINKATQGFIENSTEDKQKVMIVMSDGIANEECSEQGTGDAKQDAIQASCNAYEQYNITVHAVGFGQNTDETTLKSIATCGNGSYYYSDVSNIVEIYEQISQDIIESSYVEQTITASEQIHTKLFEDSYIQFNYQAEEVPFGLLATTESQFTTTTSGTFNIPSDSQVIEAQIVSYSGPRWTKYSQIDSTPIFNLSEYSLPYIELGDPYVVDIPTENIITGNNFVTMFTGISPGDFQPGSLANKIIYTILKQAIGYSPILAIASGCIWEIEFFDSSTSIIKVPQDYEGTSTCSYTSSAIDFNPNDAINYAVHELLSSLDLNSDGKVDTKFSEENFVIDANEISGIPYTWSSEVQVRVWR